MKVILVNQFLFIIYSIFFFGSILNEKIGKYLLVYTIFYTLYMMYRHRKNQVFIIYLIFISTYWFYMLLYYFMDIPYSGFTNLQNITYTNGTLRIQSLFVILLFSLLKSNPATIIKDKGYEKSNPIVYLLSVICMISILIFSLSGNNIFTGDYGDTTTNSTIFEYYFIFAICAQIYSNNIRKRKFVLIINLLYSISILLLGLRLVCLQVLLMIFIFNYENRLKTRWVVIISIIGFIGMSFMSFIRSNERVTFIESLGVIDGVLRTNQGDVFLTSTVHYALTKMGEFDLVFRLKSLLAFIQNIFMLPRFQNELGILNLNLGVYKVGGGGFGAMYSYVWLGYVGVIGLAIYISYFINKTRNINSYKVYGVFICITFFRWYSYSLVILFKMGLYLYIAYKISKIFASKRINKRVENKV